MNYEQNAPRDYRTYYRDVRLYYQDLMAHVETFDRVVDVFMSRDFPAPMHSALPWLRPSVSREVNDAIGRLEHTWSAYRQGLFDALGPDTEEPRLEYAAEHNIANHVPLELASNSLTESLRRWALDEHGRIRQIALAVLLLSAFLSFLVLVRLHHKTLAPLKGAIEGFHRVADGDFGHQIPVTGATETRALTTSFNQLSGRLDLLFQLIGRLQQGKGLDEVIGFLGREFPQLLRIDWIGVVLVTADGANARLEASAMDGEPEHLGKQLFPLRETLLARALEEVEPMRIPDMETTAARHPRYRFLRSLAARGLRDAVFLPLSPQTQTPIPAVVVFASRSSGSYDDAQMRFLGNIAQLVTHSFGRTVRLTEHARLAAIGEFASGIAHELRTPLTTIGLALDHLRRQQLAAGAAKRLELAVGESARMRRLLEEILLYAKPLSLDLRVLHLGGFVARFVEESQSLAGPKGQRLEPPEDPPHAPVLADEDRMRQILANLTQNACEAAPAGASISWRLTEDRDAGVVVAEVHNPGPAVPPELSERIMEPFFSTKPSGTGLGLAIVKRLVEAQGGEITIRSREGDGTRVRLAFPRSEEGAER
jgi:signal transduction histidine kinase